jgi:hypothetical protein
VSANKSGVFTTPCRLTRVIGTCIPRFSQLFGAAIPVLFVQITADFVRHLWGSKSVAGLDTVLQQSRKYSQKSEGCGRCHWARINPVQGVAQHLSNSHPYDGRWLRIYTVPDRLHQFDRKRSRPIGTQITSRNL